MPVPSRAASTLNYRHPIGLHRVEWLSGVVVRLTGEQAGGHLKEAASSLLEQVGGMVRTLLSTERLRDAEL